MLIFLPKKHFNGKNTCELDIVLTLTVNILTTNELVKLMMLCTIGPHSFQLKNILSEAMFVFGYNDTSTLVGHFVLSPRKREKRDTRNSRRDEREGQGRKRNRNESEETEEIKTFPLYPYLLQGYQALSNCKPISVGCPGDVSFVLRFYGPVNPMGSCRARSVYLTTRLLGRLSPLSG